MINPSEGLERVRRWKEKFGERSDVRGGSKANEATTWTYCGCTRIKEREKSHVYAEGADSRGAVTFKETGRGKRADKG